MTSARTKTWLTIALLGGGIVLLILWTVVLDGSTATAPAVLAALPRTTSTPSEGVAKAPATSESNPGNAAVSESGAPRVETDERSLPDLAEGTPPPLPRVVDPKRHGRPAPAPRWLVKIANRENGFVGPLREGDRFGSTVTEIDDLDGDGIRELAVGAPGDDDAGPDAGAVWILFLDKDERVRAERKLTPISAKLPAAGIPSQAFGHSLCALPDYDGDGWRELAVAQSLVPANERDPAAEVWFLELDREGAVARHRLLDSHHLYAYFREVVKSSRVTLAAPSGPFTGNLNQLAIGLPLQSGGRGDGALGWAAHFSLDREGQPSEICSSSPPQLRNGPALESGRSLLLADVSGDGFQLEILSGFMQDGNGRVERRMCRRSPAKDGRDRWLTFPRGEEPDDPGFGSSLAWLDDRGGVGTLELAIGMRERTKDQNESLGGIWIVVIARQEFHVLSLDLILPGRDGLPSHASPGDRFGASLATLTDRDDDELVDLAIGAPGDDDGAKDAGALWLFGPGGETSR